MIQRVLHIISSISLLAVIFLINKGIGIGGILAVVGIHVGYDLPQWISYIIYIVVVVGFAGILTLLFKKLRPGELTKQNIEELDADNSGLLAMLLAYIFVGLSINNGWTLLAVMLFLLIFNLCGSSHIYNPLFYLFGYHYYYVSSSKTKLLVMTKIKYPLGCEADFSNCRCLNDYTYIDMSKK
jgi:hypothetical protein